MEEALLRCQPRFLAPDQHRLINLSTPTILAFGFISPWLLWGLALGAVPILIQWLHRRNYTERVWAAMRFLQAATRAQSRRLRFESLLLLLIRTLILVLAAVALAEPFLEATGWLPGSAASVHRLLVIDTSLSLQYEVDGRPVSERAREAARRIVSDSQPGDSLQVVTIGRRGTALVRQPSYDAAEVLAEVDQLAWTQEFGDVDDALSVVQQLLNSASVSGRTEVFLISDFQRSNWWPPSPTAQHRLQRSFAELADSSELSLIHVGATDATNLALDTARISPLPVTLGTSVDVSAEVVRSGTTTRSQATVALLENDRVLQSTTMDAAVAATESISLSHRWREPGWHGLELQLPDDPLEPDNHRWVAVDVRDRLDVLLVNGRESGESLGRATDYVELALAPLSSADQPPAGIGPIVYRPVTVSEAELARTELADFDCVVLCDVPFLSDAEQVRLQTFVRGGGGLVIGAGPQLQLDAWNQWLGGGDLALMSIRLIDVIGSDDPPQPFRFAEPATPASPIVEPFVGNPQAGLTTANIYRYVQTEVRDTTDGRVAPPAVPSSAGAAVTSGVARVALSYANGDPAILETDYGAGRILFVSTSLDEQWGSWALWPSFLPMMHRLVDHATAGSAPRPALVGDVVEREYPVQSIGLSVTLQLPDGRRRAARTHVEQGATRVQFDQLAQSGLYRILLGPPLNRTELLAVNVDPRESNLRLLEERELQGTLLNGVEARLLSGADPPTSPPASAAAPSSLSRWLLMVVFVLLLVEQVMAWNARWGIIGLCASPVVLALFLVWPTVTAIGLSLALLVVLGSRWMPGRMQFPNHPAT